MAFISTFFKNAALLCLAILIGSCTDQDDKLPNVVNNSNPTEIITQDSELFTDLTKLTNASNVLPNDIVCIDMVYPLRLLIYDANLNVIDNTIVAGDIAFSSLLGALPATQSLSISYPISTVLADGTVFSVGNNSELKLAIDSCSREDIISYYNSLFGGNTASPTPCTWKVPYTLNGNNKYTGGVFEANDDGTLQFTFKNITYTGTWNFLFVDDQFHMNINLEGISQVAQDWNVDGLASINGTEINLTTNSGDYVLKQNCQFSETFAIGATGPAGGIVFYDKGYYSLGWRYMETTPTDLGVFEWGCSGSFIADSANGTLGSGLLNTAAIVNYHDDLLDYYTNPTTCNAANNGTVAAQKAVLLEFENYNDWFLPTNAELQLLYTNLHTVGLGGFSNVLYWTSTQADATHATAIDFTTGTTQIVAKIPNGTVVNARAIRYF